MQLIAVPFVVRSPEQRDAEGRKEKRALRRKAPPPPPPSSEHLAEVLEALCASNFACRDTSLPVLRNLTVQLVSIPTLGSFRVDGRERFGSKLAHWRKLVEVTKAPNLVVYMCAEKAFFLICAKPSNNQQVKTRSAICWLRDGAPGVTVERSEIKIRDLDGRPEVIFERRRGHLMCAGSQENLC